MPRRIPRLLAALSLAAVIPSISIAQEPELPIPGQFEIPVQLIVLIRAPEDGSFRLLLTFPDLDQLQGKLVYAARLLVPPIIIPEDIFLQPSLITTPWDPGTVDWDTPWAQPGGDYANEPGAFRHLPALRYSNNPLWLDVTRQVSSIAQLDRPNYGFIVKPPDEVARGYDAILAPVLESLTDVVIVGHYRVLEE